MRKLGIYSILVSCLLLVASVSLAQSVKGENVVVGKDAITTKLADGKTYVTQGNHQVFLTADPKHPLNGASGDCDGACVMDASNVAMCMGSCTQVDREGDIAFFTWDGQTEGGWKLAGGSGKWKGATGQGAWKNSVAAAPGNFARIAWEGTMSMGKK
ncbi:MAG TPA: hypothetical protein VF958_10825, partial [Thermoanaerobaculia bacterium]